MLMECAQPPYPHLETSLFLDFDGTLVPIATTPDGIVLPSALVPLLRDLYGLLNGAIAIISGRELAVLDRYTDPLRLPCAGEHGAQRRDAWGRQVESTPGDIAAVFELCAQLAKAHPALFVEQKRGGVALHYRREPALEALCLQAFDALLARMPCWTLMRGKFVVEMLPKGANKGQAITAFMQEPPFAGRVPFFVGDDLSDESGFAAVQLQRGVAVKVGSGATVARHRLHGVESVYDWLQAGCAHLRGLSRHTGVHP